jgi:L-alanine-DL-glutamate epimerase-like enolase superfamily enzyme
MHIAASTHGFDQRVPADILSPFYYEGDVIAEPLDVRAGLAVAPDGPGLGVSLDPDALEHYRDAR